MVVTGADVRVVVGGAAVVAVDAGAAVGGVAGLIVVVAEPAVVGLDVETPVDDVAAHPPLLPAGTDVPVGPTDVVGPFGDVAGDDPVTDAPGPVLAPRMVGEVLLRDGCAVVVVGEAPTLSVRMAAGVCENVASAVSTTVVPAEAFASELTPPEGCVARTTTRIARKQATTTTADSRLRRRFRVGASFMSQRGTPSVVDTWTPIARWRYHRCGTSLIVWFEGPRRRVVPPLIGDAAPSARRAVGGAGWMRVTR